MGIALCMEGLLSACYHVCPSYSNFQFGNLNIHKFLGEGICWFAIFCILWWIAELSSWLDFCKTWYFSLHRNFTIFWTGNFVAFNFYIDIFLDTAFMYMIGWLCMLKIYQTRHQDINAHAHTAYCSIAVVVLIGVIGVVSSLELFHVNSNILISQDCVMFNLTNLACQSPYGNCNNYDDAVLLNKNNNSINGLLMVVKINMMML